jgi:hypothetical protein
MHNRLTALLSLRNYLQTIDEDTQNTWCALASAENPWFTKENVIHAIKGIVHMLEPENLSAWINNYKPTTTPKNIAIIMAGNLPLVGFHDFLCVYLMGHHAQIKLSSKDARLFPLIIQELRKYDSDLSVSVTTGTLSAFDAVIATGSDNAARYFDFYFSKYPSIIRKNRTSAAILSGHETDEDYNNLGEDVFRYFGLGCRNVSSLFIPAGFYLPALLNNWEVYNYVIQHHKYANNYDYQKAIKLINNEKHLDTGFVLVCENEKLVSPISVVHYQFYKNEVELNNLINNNQDKLQCVVGTHTLCNVAFGKTQFPSVNDYADGINTLTFLQSLK